MIFFYHTPGAGGRSVIMSFLEQVGGLDRFDEYFYRSWDVLVGNKRFQRTSIPDPNTYFASSAHRPMEECKTPPGAFRFTLLRDPVTRFIGKYRQHHLLSRQNKDASAWTGKDILECCANLPKSKLLAQLAEFSLALDITEAITNILKLDNVFRCETMLDNMKVLTRKLRLSPPLRTFTERDGLLLRSGVSQEEIAKNREYVAKEVSKYYDYLRELFDPEYQWMSALGFSEENIWVIAEKQK